MKNNEYVFPDDQQNVGCSSEETNTSSPTSVEMDTKRIPSHVVNLKESKTHLFVVIQSDNENNDSAQQLVQIKVSKERPPSRKLNSKKMFVHCGNIDVPIDINQEKTKATHKQSLASIHKRTDHPSFVVLPEVLSKIRGHVRQTIERNQSTSDNSNETYVIRSREENRIGKRKVPILFGSLWKRNTQPPASLWHGIDDVTEKPKPEDFCDCDQSKTTKSNRDSSHLHKRKTEPPASTRKTSQAYLRKDDLFNINFVQPSQKHTTQRLRAGQDCEIRYKSCYLCPNMKRIFPPTSSGRGRNAFRSNNSDNDSTSTLKHRCGYVKINYKLVRQCLIYSPATEKCEVLDAIRLRLKSADSKLAINTIEDIVKFDLFGVQCECRSTPLLEELFWPVTASHELQISTARFVNALVSYKLGRNYFVKRSVIRMLIWGEIGRDNIDPIMGDNLIGIMMKLSGSRFQRTDMIENGLVRWLLQHMEEEEYSATKYHVQCMAGLLRNLLRVYNLENLKPLEMQKLIVLLGRYLETEDVLTKRYICDSLMAVFQNINMIATAKELNFQRVIQDHAMRTTNVKEKEHLRAILQLLNTSTSTKSFSRQKFTSSSEEETFLDVNLQPDCDMEIDSYPGECLLREEFSGDGTAEHKDKARKDQDSDDGNSTPKDGRLSARVFVEHLNCFLPNIEKNRIFPLCNSRCADKIQTCSHIGDVQPKRRQHYIPPNSRTSGISRPTETKASDKRSEESVQRIVSRISTISHDKSAARWGLFGNDNGSDSSSVDETTMKKIFASNSMGTDDFTSGKVGKKRTAPRYTSQCEEIIGSVSYQASADVLNERGDDRQDIDEKIVAQRRLDAQQSSETENEEYDDHGIARARKTAKNENPLTKSEEELRREKRKRDPLERQSAKNLSVEGRRATSSEFTKQKDSIHKDDGVRGLTSDTTASTSVQTMTLPKELIQSEKQSNLPFLQTEMLKDARDAELSEVENTRARDRQLFGSICETIPITRHASENSLTQKSSTERKQTKMRDNEIDRSKLRAASEEKLTNVKKEREVGKLDDAKTEDKTDRNLRTEPNVARDREEIRKGKDGKITEIQMDGNPRAESEDKLTNIARDREEIRNVKDGETATVTDKKSDRERQVQAENMDTNLKRDQDKYGKVEGTIDQDKIDREQHLIDRNLADRGREKSGKTTKNTEITFEETAHQKPKDQGEKVTTKTGGNRQPRLNVRSEYILKKDSPRTISKKDSPGATAKDGLLPGAVKETQGLKVRSAAAVNVETNATKIDKSVRRSPTPKLAPRSTKQIHSIGKSRSEAAITNVVVQDGDNKLKVRSAEMMIAQRDTKLTKTQTLLNARSIEGLASKGTNKLSEQENPNNEASEAPQLRIRSIELVNQLKGKHESADPREQIENEMTMRTQQFVPAPRSTEFVNNDRKIRPRSATSLQRLRNAPNSSQNSIGKGNDCVDCNGSGYVLRARPSQPCDRCRTSLSKYPNFVDALNDKDHQRRIVSSTSQEYIKVTWENNSDEVVITEPNEGKSNKEKLDETKIGENSSVPKMDTNVGQGKKSSGADVPTSTDESKNVTKENLTVAKDFVKEGKVRSGDDAVSNENVVTLHTPETRKIASNELVSRDEMTEDQTNDVIDETEECIVHFATTRDDSVSHRMANINAEPEPRNGSTQNLALKDLQTSERRTPTDLRSENNNQIPKEKDVLGVKDNLSSEDNKPSRVTHDVTAPTNLSVDEKEDLISAKRQDHEQVVHETDEDNFGASEVLPPEQMRLSSGAGKLTGIVRKVDDVKCDVKCQSVMETRSELLPLTSDTDTRENITSRVRSNTVSNSLKFSENLTSLGNGQVGIDRVKSSPNVSADVPHAIGRRENTPCLSTKTIEIKDETIPVKDKDVTLMKVLPTSFSTSYDNETPLVPNYHQLSIGTEGQLQTVTGTVVFPSSTEIVGQNIGAMGSKTNVEVNDNNNGSNHKEDAPQYSNKISHIDIVGLSESQSQTNKDVVSLDSSIFVRDNIQEFVSKDESTPMQINENQDQVDQELPFHAKNVESDNPKNDPLIAARSFEIVTSQDVILHDILQVPHSGKIENEKSIAVVVEEVRVLVSTDEFLDVVRGEMLEPLDNQNDKQSELKLENCEPTADVGATREPMSGSTSPNLVEIVESPVNQNPLDESIRNRDTEWTDAQSIVEAVPQDNQTLLSEKKNVKPYRVVGERENQTLSTVSVGGGNLLLQDNEKHSSESLKNGNIVTTSQPVLPAESTGNVIDETLVTSSVSLTNRSETERNQSFATGLKQVPMLYHIPFHLVRKGISKRTLPFVVKRFSSTKPILLAARSIDAMHERRPIKKRKYDEAETENRDENVAFNKVTQLMKRETTDGRGSFVRKSIVNKASTVLDEVLIEERNLRLDSQVKKVDTVCGTALNRDISSGGFHLSIEDIEGTGIQKVKLVNSTCCRQLLNNDELINRLSDKVLEKLITKIHRCGPNCKSPCGGIDSYLPPNKANK